MVGKKLVLLMRSLAKVEIFFSKIFTSGSTCFTKLKATVKININTQQVTLALEHFEGKILNNFEPHK